MKELLIGIVLATLVAVTKKTAENNPDKITVISLCVMYGGAAAAIVKIIEAL